LYLSKEKHHELRKAMMRHYQSEVKSHPQALERAGFEARAMLSLKECLSGVGAEALTLKCLEQISAEVRASFEALW